LRPRSGRATRHSPLPAVRGAAPAADAPAGLIRGDDRAGLRAADQRDAGRLQTARRPCQRLGHPTRGDRDAELAEQPGDLARRQAQAPWTPTPPARPRAGRPGRRRRPTLARSAQDDGAGHVVGTAGSGRSGCRSGRPRSPAVGDEVFLILTGHPELLDLSGELVARLPAPPQDWLPPIAVARAAQPARHRR
jgi:hypothetical protein